MNYSINAGKMCGVVYFGGAITIRSYFFYCKCVQNLIYIYVYNKNKCTK